MADPSILEMTVREVNARGDRLYSRGVSKLSTDTPEQKRDLRIAGRLLWILGNEVGPARILRVEGA